MRALGICIGACTISVVEVVRQDRFGSSEGRGASSQVENARVFPHDGRPKETLLSALNGSEPEGFDRIAVTGRRLRESVALSSIAEIEAVEHAYGFVRPKDRDCPAVLSAGGETFMAYLLDRKGRVSNVVTGNKCASGTGEFFLQQIRRMNVTLDEASEWAVDESPYHVSGRCSVFCKSDCTHACNKGVPKSKVTAGLGRMMAEKALELLSRTDLRDVMLTGGSSKNRMMTGHLAKAIPGLIVPPEATYFEALGAALWALENETRPFPGADRLFYSSASSFGRLPVLARFRDAVDFMEMKTSVPDHGDDCILGLDVGSTTTKAVLMRRRDDAVLASVYLRTDGDPVGAAVKCYRGLSEKIGGAKIGISGFGVTGSGRQIAGLHGRTDGVINELIAHARAAVHFDSSVDTIVEIGGQDAKYTHLINGVPSDYAMNEACSAGTGSFLEEAAWETLGIRAEEIASIAMKGVSPLNFNDQCAAFISSDIKTALHEAHSREDISAGIVYSVCMNYVNRVKGNRQVGERIFMQGGVCCNQAVPLAMASLLGRPITVPPEPGLMGAYGVALEVKKRQAEGTLPLSGFDLQTLAGRRIEYGSPFICGGGKEKCDRHCEITVVIIDGTRHPFGGACNRYYNIRRSIDPDSVPKDLVRARQALVYGGHESSSLAEPDCRGGRRKTVGVNKAFLVNTYFPLYSAFFCALGFDVLIPEASDAHGIERKNAAFCFPAELSHGFFSTLISRNDPPDYLFMPHFRAVPSSEGHETSQVCPFVQAEPSYLKTAFRKELAALQGKGTRVLSPLLDFTKGLRSASKAFAAMAHEMGVKRSAAEAAFEAAVERQEDRIRRMKELGRKALHELASDPQKKAVVVFGRPYSAYASEANMGIPNKFTSSGVGVIPMDLLPFDDEPAGGHMYWGIGQQIMKAASYVARHPQLFGAYITNFSCGPDSFLLGYFREMMGPKPSLILELDSHTADAGVETRIEAFLDIVSGYAPDRKKNMPEPFRPAAITSEGGGLFVTDSSGVKVSVSDGRVTMLIPSMGRYFSESLSAVFRGIGFNSTAYEPADPEILKTGRANTSCRECLPLILTTGSLLNYVRKKKRPDEIVLYFMPTGSGPCRFGQYNVFMQDMVKRLRIEDAAIFSLSSENAYAGLDRDFDRRAWWAITVSDTIEDIRHMLLAAALDRESALKILEEEWTGILRELETGSFKRLSAHLSDTAARLAKIPLKRPASEVPRILLTGEIFVRKDPLSRRFIPEYLAERGFAAVCSPIAEWILYADWLVDNGLAQGRMTWSERLRFGLKKFFAARYEARIKKLLSGSGLIPEHKIDIDAVIAASGGHISRELAGEAILTVGGTINDMAKNACGVIALGPFGCMPNRIAESVLTEIMTASDMKAAFPRDKRLHATLEGLEDLPFLAVESDGASFPQPILSKLEAFCLRAARLHEKMRAGA